MLVLRRRVGETIVVGGDVEIEIIEISRSRVKLGIRAPFHVPVIRKETLPVARQNQMAVELMASRGQEGVGQLVVLMNRPAAAELVIFPGVNQINEGAELKSGGALPI